LALWHLHFSTANGNINIDGVFLIIIIIFIMTFSLLSLQTIRRSPAVSVIICGFGIIYLYTFFCFASQVSPPPHAPAFIALFQWDLLSISFKFVTHRPRRGLTMPSKRR